MSILIYYLTRNKANSYAKQWYDRNYCKILYPNANIESQRISDMFASIGTEKKLRKFFYSYFEWQKSEIGETELGNILIDSTGLPNNVHFQLTAVSNHNGKISKEVRLIYVVHKSTGMPIYFRYCRGNIIDATTITNTIEELKKYNFDIEHAILDAGYYTRENVDTLFGNNVNFITRLQQNRKLYKDIVNNNLNDLEHRENFVRYGARFLYIICVECRLEGINKSYNGYAYLIKDINRAHDEEEKEVLRGIADEIDADKIYDNIQNKGIFIIISSEKYKVESVLPIYYARQQIEQVFDIVKNNVSILPLRTHNENTFRGHLVITFIATAIFRKLQILMSNFRMVPEKALDYLERQMCKVYPDMILPSEADRDTNDIFRLADIKFPDKISRPHG